MKIAKNLTDLIGNTPLLELSNYNKENNLKATLIGKLEAFNPGSSVKDRIGHGMIKDAEDKGLINKDTILIEATSGNTGIALAFIASAKGYKLILTMPDTMSLERRKLLKALGAELVLTPGAKGMNGAIEKAEELKKQYDNSIILKQFSNPSNPEIHKKTTAQEILRDTDGNIDIFIAGVGTGGTISGVGEVLKEKNSNIEVIAVEPKDSPVLSGGEKGPHKIQGIGAGFIPENYNKDVVDRVVQISNEDSFKYSRLLAKTEGLLVGISSGAVLAAATEIAKKEENKGKNIVIILPSNGERYLSTELFDI